MNIKFFSTSKHFSENLSGTNYINSLDSNSELVNKGMNLNYGSSAISIKENDELTVNCVVNSSKPAANLSIWLWKKSIRRSLDEDESKKLEIIDSHSNKNKDLTLKSYASAKLVVNRNDHNKFVVCMAENVVLNEKWESKRALNVLCNYKLF